MGSPQDHNIGRGIERFFALSTDMLCIVGYDGYLKRVNPVFEKALGYTQAELLAQPLSSFVHPDDNAHTRRSIQQLSPDRSPIHFENRLRHRDGSYRLYRWALSYTDTEIFHAVAREEGASESPFETLNNWLIDAPAGIIILHGTEHVITLVNSLYEKISGHTRSQLVGRRLIEVFPELYVQGIGEIFRRIYATGEAFSAEEFYAAFDHTGQGFLEEGYYNFVAQPVKDSSGQVTDLFVHVYEVTDYVRARQKLQESEEQFRAIFHQSVVGKAQADLDGHMILVNDRFCEIVGYSREELLQMRLQDITHPDDLDYNVELFERMKIDGIPFTTDKRYIRKDGSVVWVRNSVGPIRDADGHIKYSLTASFDITAMKSAEKMLMEHQREIAIAEERQRLARELHDSATQSLFSASVLTQSIPRLFQSQPERALTELNNLNDLIQGASSELRTMLWELRPDRILQTSLSTLLVQLVTAAQAWRPIKVRLHVHDDKEQALPPDVLMAYYRIAQESINNTVKHSEASQVILRVRRTDTYLVLVIADDGQGFDTTQEHPGFGLMNMRERAAEADVQLDLRSRLGHGTRVRLFWQRNEAQLEKTSGG